MKDDVMADTWSMVREERSDMLSFCETLSEEHGTPRRCARSGASETSSVT